MRGRKAAAGQQDLCHNSVLHGVRHLPRASNVFEARSAGDTDLANTVATNSAIGEVVADMAGAAAASTQCTPPAGADVMYSSCKSLCHNVFAAHTVIIEELGLNALQLHH